MTFSKTGRLPVLAGLLCLLLMGFAGVSQGAVRFDVVPSPTEVINTGLSEVTGSINLVVRGAGNVTGTSLGGANQIGVIYNANGTFMPIDNTVGDGIRVFYSAGFTSAAPSILTTGGVVNAIIGGKCSGFITLNLKPGATPVEGDFIRIEGVRGRIAASSGVTQGTDLFASLQSINDPAAASFAPDIVRVAKSLPGMNVAITAANLLLCFPTTGQPPAGTAVATYSIKITEGFARAFVDNDSGAAGLDATDRVDSGGQAGILTGDPAVPGTPLALGDPDNQTRFTILLDSIPASVSAIIWPATVATSSGTGAVLTFVSQTAIDASGNAAATYAYDAADQVNVSDITVESFTIAPVATTAPIVTLKTGATATGTINAAVTLSPNGGSAACEAPNASTLDVQPRFLLVPQSDADPSNVPPGDASKAFAIIIRCQCFMLFTYATADASFNTGISVANTSLDTQVFGTAGAAQQVGKVTFYFYSATQGFRGSFTTADIPPGQSFVGLLSQMLGSASMPDTSFSGYIIARAEFQFCHAVSYIADQRFAATAQGYPALIIPDPAIKAPSSAGGRRIAADAGDITNLPSGEGLNN
jgi:hypothetical protein